MNCLSLSRARLLGVVAAGLALAAGREVAGAEPLRVVLPVEGNVRLLESLKLGDEAFLHLVVVTTAIDERDVRRRILTFFGPDPNKTEAGFIGYAAARREVAPEDAVAFALGNFLDPARRDLLYLTGSSAVAVPPDSEPVWLLRGERLLITTPGSSLEFWDGVVDLNRDGRDDLILAGPNAYRIYLQTEGGSLRQVAEFRAESGFASPDGLGGRGFSRPGAAFGGGTSRARSGNGNWGGRSGPAADEIRFERWLARLCIADADGDGLLDLLTLRDGAVQVLRQSPAGSFRSEPDRGFEFSTLAEPSPIDPRATRLIHGDADGDGRVDFLIAELDVKELHTRLRFFNGEASGQSETPDQVLKVTGLGTTPRLIDVDCDGALDLTLLTLRADKLLAARKPEVEDVDATFYVFLFQREPRRFSTRPDLQVEFTVAVGGALEAEQAAELFRMEGDFNGDGWKDFLSHENKGEWKVQATRRTERSGKLMLERAPLWRMPAELPRHVRIADLDGDGRSEAILAFNDRIEILWTP